MIGYGYLILVSSQFNMVDQEYLKQYSLID